MLNRRIVLLSIGSALLALFGGHPWVQAQEPNRAVIVIRFGEDAVEARCVAFSEPQISGYEALQRAGFVVNARFEGLGGAMCGIEETGCPAGDCFCQCKGGDECVYWSYWHQAESSWRYAAVGATTYQLSDGSVDGWSWGPGSVTSAIEPPLVSLEEVCSSPESIGVAEAEPEVVDPSRAAPLLVFVFVAALLVIALLLVSRRRPQA